MISICTFRQVETSPNTLLTTCLMDFIRGRNNRKFLVSMPFSRDVDTYALFIFIHFKELSAVAVARGYF